MNKYIEADIALARLLGWGNVRMAPDGAGATGSNESQSNVAIPAFSRTPDLWREIGQRYGCEAEIWKGAAWVGNGDVAWMQHEPLESHNDESLALGYATVRAVVARIEHERAMS